LYLATNDLQLDANRSTNTNTRDERLAVSRVTRHARPNKRLSPESVPSADTCDTRRSAPPRRSTEKRLSSSSRQTWKEDLEVHGVLGEEVLALRRLGNHAQERLHGQTRDREQGGEQDGHREAELALALFFGEKRAERRREVSARGWKKRRAPRDARCFWERKIVGVVNAHDRARDGHRDGGTRARPRARARPRSRSRRARSGRTTLWRDVPRSSRRAPWAPP
jgi:hypothetical protein